jgi:hypothetical protein
VGAAELLQFIDETPSNSTTWTIAAPLLQYVSRALLGQGTSATVTAFADAVRAGADALPILADFDTLEGMLIGLDGSHQEEFRALLAVAEGRITIDDADILVGGTEE